MSVKVEKEVSGHEQLLKDSWNQQSVGWLKGGRKFVSKKTFQQSTEGVQQPIHKLSIEDKEVYAVVMKSGAVKIAVRLGKSDDFDFTDFNKSSKQEYKDAMLVITKVLQSVGVTQKVLTNISSKKDKKDKWNLLIPSMCSSYDNLGSCDRGRDREGYVCQPTFRGGMPGKGLTRNEQEKLFKGCRTSTDSYRASWDCSLERNPDNCGQEPKKILNSTPHSG